MCWVVNESTSVLSQSGVVLHGPDTILSSDMLPVGVELIMDQVSNVVMMGLKGNEHFITNKYKCIEF